MFSIFLAIDEETPLETGQQRRGISDYLSDGITETRIAHNLTVHWAAGNEMERSRLQC